MADKTDFPWRYCTTCGDRLEAGAPGDVCYGCHLDTYIPHWYPGAERYAFDRVWGHRNATEQPKTGRDILDAPSGMVIEEAMLRCKNKPRLR